MTDRVEIYPASQSDFTVKWFRHTEWRTQTLGELSQDDLDEILAHIGWTYEVTQKDGGWLFLIYKNDKQKIGSSMAFKTKKYAAAEALRMIVAIEKSKALDIPEEE